MEDRSGSFFVDVASSFLQAKRRMLSTLHPDGNTESCLAARSLSGSLEESSARPAQQPSLSSEDALSTPSDSLQVHLRWQRGLRSAAQLGKGLAAQRPWQRQASARSMESMSISATSKSATADLECEVTDAAAEGEGRLQGKPGPDPPAGAKAGHDAAGAATAAATAGAAHATLPAGQGSQGSHTERIHALLLRTEHWLEVTDPRHRYGSNLRPYFEHWLTHHEHDSSCSSRSSSLSSAQCTHLNQAGMQPQQQGPQQHQHQQHQLQGQPACGGTGASIQGVDQQAACRSGEGTEAVAAAAAALAVAAAAVAPLVSDRHVECTSAPATPLLGGRHETASLMPCNRQTSLPVSHGSEQQAGTLHSATHAGMQTCVQQGCSEPCSQQPGACPIQQPPSPAQQVHGENVTEAAAAAAATTTTHRPGPSQQRSRDQAQESEEGASMAPQTPEAHSHAGTAPTDTHVQHAHSHSCECTVNSDAVASEAIMQFPGVHALAVPKGPDTQPPSELSPRPTAPTPMLLSHSRSHKSCIQLPSLPEPVMEQCEERAKAVQAHAHAHACCTSTSSSGSKDNFFRWLDYGEGMGVDLGPTGGPPRQKLDNERVTYLTPEQLAQYEVVVNAEGLLVYKASGQVLHTGACESAGSVQPEAALPGPAAGKAHTATAAEATGDQAGAEPEVGQQDAAARGLEVQRSLKSEKWIYVVDTQGCLYVHAKVRGRFHHSSFLRGGAVLAAGALVVHHGKLVTLTADSGHYHPQPTHFRWLYRHLQAQGADLTALKGIQFRTKH